MKTTRIILIVFLILLVFYAFYMSDPLTCNSLFIITMIIAAMGAGVLVGEITGEKKSSKKIKGFRRLIKDIDQKNERLVRVSHEGFIVNKKLYEEISKIKLIHQTEIDLLKKQMTVKDLNYSRLNKKYTAKQLMVDEMKDLMKQIIKE